MSASVRHFAAPRLAPLLAACSALALAACSGAPPATACNGHDELCARRYDQVVFPGTHNAYSNRAENFGAPDQSYPLSRQLADGVRVLHLELQLFGGEVNLCHGVCEIGNQLLTDGLAEVRAFSDAHPREVVSLLLESSGVTSDAVAAAFAVAGLTGRLHAQAPGAPWPTLGEMLAHGDRVVALLADLSSTGGGRQPLLLDRFVFTWETPWNNRVPQDFIRCDADRGARGNDLYVVDTYLEDQVIPTPEHARLVNVNPFLAERLGHCRASAGRLPSFVMVNYYEVGDLFRDVDALNGLAPPSGGDLDGFPESWIDAGAAVSDAGGD